MEKKQIIIDKGFLILTMLFSAFCVGLFMTVFILWDGYMSFIGLVTASLSGLLYGVTFNEYRWY